MVIHNVKSGDNLWQISIKYNTPINSIIKVNGLVNPGDLVIGMELVVPNEETIINYSVKPGDTLWEISKRFNTDLQEILRINNINPPYTLYVNQNLIIPIKANKYIVKSGDMLWSIAQKLNISVKELVRINSLSYPYNIYPGQMLTISLPKPQIETLGYYNPEGLTDKTAIVKSLGKFLTYLGIFHFPITSSGDIIGTIDSSILRAAQVENVKILPVITNLKNGNFDRDIVYNVLNDTQKSNTFINNILSLINKYNLVGIIIDIENLAPGDADVFTDFIKQLFQRLHQYNKILVLNIPAKWERWADKEWVGFFDFNRLGPYMDIAAIMTYEFGWRSGPPRPTVPLDYITRSLNYAINNNISPNQILLGFTLYGYDWELPNTEANLAKTVTLPNVWNLARKYNAPIIFDEKEKQPYVKYIDNAYKNHIIWFENARTHYIKYQLIKEYKLRGAFYWILNQPFPSTFYMLDNMFTIVKL